MVRVLQLVPTHSLGGALLSAMVIAEGLDSQQYESVLAVGSDAGPEGSLLQDIRGRGIEVELLPSLCRAPHPWKDLRAILQLRGLLRRWQPHIVHTHGSKAKLLLPSVARLAPVPVKVAHIHGWEWYPARSRVARCLITAASRLTARAYDALIAGSDAMRREGLEAGVGRPEQYGVVRAPVDTAAFKPDGREATRRRVRAELGLPPEAYAVVSVMRLAPQKAPFDLISAARLIVDARPDVYFLIIGGGELEEQVREAIEARRLGDNVRLLGVRRDVPALLKAADLFALSSAWEALGIVYLEASAVGLPCVGTRVGGSPEAIEDGVTGLLVPPSDPRALAEAILKIVNDPELGMQLGRAGQEKAKTFAISRYLQQVDHIYRRLLEARDLAEVGFPQTARDSRERPELGDARAGTP